MPQRISFFNGYLLTAESKQGNKSLELQEMQRHNQGQGQMAEDKSEVEFLEMYALNYRSSSVGQIGTFLYWVKQPVFKGLCHSTMFLDVYR